MLCRLQQASLFWARKTLSNPISRQCSGSLLRGPKVLIWVLVMVHVGMAASQKLHRQHLPCLSALIATTRNRIEVVTQEYEPSCLLKWDLFENFWTLLYPFVNQPVGFKILVFLLDFPLCFIPTHACCTGWAAGQLTSPLASIFSPFTFFLSYLVPNFSSSKSILRAISFPR